MPPIAPIPTAHGPDQYPTRVAPTPRPLPIRVRIARTDDDLEEAVAVRASAYSRHIPQAARRLRRPESYDFAQNSLILIASEKPSGRAIATMRIQTNATEGPLNVLAKINAPRELRGHTIAEINRLAVLPGPHSTQAKMALFKACYLFAIASQIDYFVTGARAPIDRTYISLGFVDVSPGGLTFENHELAGVRHRVLTFNVHAAERNWFNTAHPLYDFMIGQFHPDIEIFASVSSRWSRPRRVPRVPPANERLAIPRSQAQPLGWPLV